MDERDKEYIKSNCYMANIFWWKKYASLNKSKNLKIEKNYY